MSELPTASCFRKGKALLETGQASCRSAIIWSGIMREECLQMLAVKRIGYVRIKKPQQLFPDHQVCSPFRSQPSTHFLMLMGSNALEIWFTMQPFIIRSQRAARVSAEQRTVLGWPTWDAGQTRCSQSASHHAQSSTRSGKERKLYKRPVRSQHQSHIRHMENQWRWLNGIIGCKIVST